MDKSKLNERLFSESNIPLSNSDLIKAAAIESTNQLLARNGMTPIDVAKESILRKEETRMVRAKND